MHFLNTIILLFFAVNGVVFMGTRVLLFSENYALGKRIKSEHERFASMCLTHSDLREIEPRRCQERTVASEMSPWVYALKQVAAKTPTCGYMSCTDIYGAILDKSSSMAFNLILGAGVFVLFYGVLVRIAAPAMKPQYHMNHQNAYLSGIEYGSRPVEYNRDHSHHNHHHHQRVLRGNANLLEPVVEEVCDDGRTMSASSSRRRQYHAEFSD